MWPANLNSLLDGPYFELDTTDKDDTIFLLQIV